MATTREEAMASMRAVDEEAALATLDSGVADTLRTMQANKEWRSVALEFRDAGSGSRSIRRQIRRAQRANFAVSGQTGVGSGMRAGMGMRLKYSNPMYLDDVAVDFPDMPMVREGAFRHTSNAMYGLVFLGLWGIALLFGSWNALVVALFQHAYIWVHMYCTEAPDMRRIYGP